MTPTPFSARSWRKVAQGVVPIALITLFGLLACDDDPVAPPATGVHAPTSLTILVNGNQVSFAWTPPATVEATSKYKLVRRLNAAPTGPTDANATVVYDGTALTFSQDLSSYLPDEVGSPHRYYFAVFGCNATGDCETGGARADIAIFVDAPTNFTINVAANRVTFAWSPPGFIQETTKYKLVRRLNAAPTGPSDANATVVYDGTALTASQDLSSYLPDVAGSPHRYYFAVFGCDAAGSCETTGAREDLAPSLVQCLQAGGYTIFWRHGTANVCVDNLNLGTAAETGVPNWWKVCATVCVPDTTPRQIADAGRNESIVIGQQVDRLAIPFGRVLSSEFCRCLTTAQLADLGPAIEESQVLTYFVYDEANRCANTYTLLGQVPSPGTNTALFSHMGFPNVCDVIGGLNSGECAIFKPDGAGGVTYITRLAWNAWEAL